MPSPDSRWQSLPDRAHSIAWLVAGFTALRLLLAATAPLLPQEAYYWSWTRHLDWSYFDHPPLVSYSMALTTGLFGQTVFGIKSAAVFWALGWNLLWVRLVLDMYGDRRLAFWSVAALNLTFVYEAFGLAPTPDSPLIFAWTGAIWALWRLSQSGDGRWWFATGGFIGLAMLGKYSAVLLGLVVLLYLLTSPRQRHWFVKPQPYLAVGVAVAVFAPVLIWNAQHDWVSLAFQSSRRVGEMGGFKPRYFLMLVATQFLLVTPYLFVVAMAALARGARGGLGASVDDRSRLLWLSGAVPIVVFSLVSFRSIAKINWLAPAYWSLIILGVQVLLAREDGLRRLLRGLASSAVLLLAAGLVFWMPNLPVPGDMNAWSGWQQAAARVAKAEAAVRAEGRQTFVFGPNYKIASLMRFYLPGQPRTYAHDIYGDKALQFDYFPLDRDLRGATGILVVSDQDAGDLDLERLKPWFESVQRIDTVEARAFGQLTRRVDIYRAENYKGHPRQNAGRAAPGGSDPATR